MTDIHPPGPPPATSPGAADDAAPAPTDGRAARAERTRTVIVDALLGLLEEGDPHPTANRIAERAGISLRLIYHHFGDLESLFRAASQRQGERMAAMAVPIDPDLPLADRIALLVDERTAMLEWITPVRRAALLQEPYSDELVAAREAFYDRGERRLHEVFATELDPLDPARRAVVVSALHGALTWGCWNDLRSSGRTIEEATAAVHATVSALLATC